MDKRFQVFISSTHQDLQEERQEVMQALLELDCIPAGMELFPAANQDQWSLIKKVIDNCDYYILISAGRYGSIGPDGVGYTEMEYRYALEQNKPILAFLHKEPSYLPANRCEPTDEGKKRLDVFRDFVKAKMVRFWTSPAELGSQVSRSLITLIKTEPAIGWIRADALPSEDLTKELLTLRRESDELRRQLAEATTAAPPGAEELAQGEDKFILEVEFPAHTVDMDAETTITYGFPTTWNAVFAGIAPTMIHEATDYTVRRALNAFAFHLGSMMLDEDSSILSYNTNPGRWNVISSDFDTIRIQLRSLGLITKSTRERSLKDTATYWTLTPRGDELMSRLRAIRRDNTTKWRV